MRVEEAMEVANQWVSSSYTPTEEGWWSAFGVLAAEVERLRADNEVLRASLAQARAERDGYRR